jgi:ribosomal protein S1
MVAVKDVIENVTRRLRGLDAVESVEGRVVTGRITAIENDMAVIDVGLKSEGRVALREFAAPGQKAELKVGDEVEVFVDRVENPQGEAMLSRDRARREAAWDKLEIEFTAGNPVEGIIFGRVKGGFTVDLGGAVAFLPGSQVDIGPVGDATPLMDVPQAFRILKMDRRRGNIVVSRRAILEETRAEQRSTLIQSLHEGQVVEGVVKNITDYGAFVDLGGIEGLLHVTDISYKRVNHPSEVMNVGDTVPVQIIRINRDTQRISLGMKQLETDPWEGVAVKYPVGGVFRGRVTNITEYGAFVELEPGIEGLVHVSEMSSTKKNVHPGKIVSISQKVDVSVLKVDHHNRRISLSMTRSERAAPRPSQIPNAFVLASAQMLVDSLHEPAKLHSILAELTSWEAQGSSVWLGALRALYRDGERNAADRLAQNIHGVLVQTEHYDLVPELFLAQAAAYDRLGDTVARDLFAVEAADGFMRLEDSVSAETALHLARC